MTTALTFQTTTFNIIDRNGHFWLRGTQIAEALGYSDDRAISKLYASNRDEFTPAMTDVVVSATSGNLQNRTRIFSLRGAHLLAMFARTPVAADFRRWVLDILDRETAVPPAPTFEAVAEERLRFGRFIVHLDLTSGRPQLSEVSKNACIIDPDNPSELQTFINEFVRFEQIPVVLQAAMNRVNLCYQAVKSKAALLAPAAKPQGRQWKDPAEVEDLLKSMRFREDEMYDFNLIPPERVVQMHRAGMVGPRQWAKLKRLMTA